MLIVIDNTDRHGSMTHSGAPCAREGSLIPKKMGFSTHPRNFGNHVTVSRLSAPQVYQCKITKSSCMATQLRSPKKYPYPPPLPRRALCFRPLDPHPWNFCNFSTWLGTLWKGYFRKKSWCTIFLCEG